MMNIYSITADKLYIVENKPRSFRAKLTNKGISIRSRGMRSVPKIAGADSRQMTIFAFDIATFLLIIVVLVSSKRGHHF